jgi:hypothetical protein
MKNYFIAWPIMLLLVCMANLLHAADSLTANQQFTQNQYLASDNGKFRFYMQGDGNLVLRDWATRNSLWSSGTHGKGGIRVKLQSDGNLVMRNNSGRAVWSSKTAKSGASRLAMQDDGNLVLYTSSGKAVWATDTAVDSSSGSGGGSSNDNDQMVNVLKQVRSLKGTIVLDWDNTIDIDSDYTVGKTASLWLNAFAEANVDAWLVTGNGNNSRIESAVLASVSSANDTYWKYLLRNKAYYGESTGNKEDKYELIVGNRDKAEFMIADDAGSNIDDFEDVTDDKGYLYEPNSGYATYSEFLGHLKNFQKQLQDNANSGSGGTSSGNIQHIGTTEVWDRNGQGVKINRPSGTRSGDLMVLVLHRTDDHLPFAVSGWNRGAECYKEDNGYQCLTVSDCTSKSGNFCDRFDGKYRGRDLAQVVFYKRAGSNEPSSYRFNLNKDSSGHPGWAILTTLRGANTSSPIRDSSNRGCDKNSDSLFPSVYGKKGDMLLLSQSFDDAVSKSKFGAPSGMSTFGYVSNSDEAGFLYGAILGKDGETGKRKTRGDGASSCKDALVSLSIKAK